jgi:translation initiation factor 2 subunit 1
LEYNDKEALILASNTTRKRVRNVKKLLRLGSLDVMQVISVEKEGGYIDLSKRTLQAAEVEQKKIDYEKAKQVHLILRLTAF